MPKHNSFNYLEKLELKKYDGFIITGDFVEEDIYYFFKSYNKDLFCVYGNMDDIFLKNNLKEKIVFQLSKFQIGIIHGHQTGFAYPEKLISVFNKKIDLLIYGHSHKKDNRLIDNIRVINPGAFCDGDYGELIITKNNYNYLSFNIKNEF